MKHNDTSPPLGWHYLILVNYPAQNYKKPKKLKECLKNYLDRETLWLNLIGKEIYSVKSIPSSSTIALELHFTSFYDVSEILNTLGSHKRAISFCVVTVRMSWAFLQGEMTSFVIFFSSCLVFIISLSLFNIIWERKTFSKSPSSSWEVIWGNQRRPLSLFHIPFANADRDHHPARWEAKARLWQQFFHNERFQRMANDRQGEWKLYT